MSKFKSFITAIIFTLLAGHSYQAQANLNSPISASILPGVFYLSVYGDLQSGIDLDGLGFAGTGPQTGYWNGTKWQDFIEFYDASPVDGFRLQFSLNSDFIYSGIYPQSDIAAENLKTFADWNTSTSQGIAPTVSMDSSITTATLLTAESCPSANPVDLTFHPNFSLNDFSQSFSTTPFNYLTSSINCYQTGFLNLGRFQLELGDAEAGDYQSSIFIIMVDGT